MREVDARFCLCKLRDCARSTGRRQDTRVESMAIGVVAASLASFSVQQSGDCNRAAGLQRPLGLETGRQRASIHKSPAENAYPTSAYRESRTPSA
jgi:hypothetical protein